MDTMKNSLIAFSLVILFSFGVAAQSGTSVASNTVAETAIAARAPDVQTPNVVPLIGAGTGVVAELSNNINAKKAKPGDRVKAQVTQDVLYRGKIVMRVGTKLIGHVQAAKPFTKEDPDSQLNIVFDRAELKGGGELALMGSIRALAPTVNVSMVDRPDQMAMPAVTGVQGIMRGPAPVGGGPSRTSGTGNRNATPPSPTATSGSSAANASFNPAAMQSGNFSRDNRLHGSASRGVIGMRGMTLTNTGSGPTQSSVISSNRDHVKLESGIQIVVQLNVPVTQ